MELIPRLYTPVKCNIHDRAIIVAYKTIDGKQYVVLSNKLIVPIDELQTFSYGLAVVI